MAGQTLALRSREARAQSRSALLTVAAAGLTRSLVKAVERLTLYTHANLLCFLVSYVPLALRGRGAWICARSAR